MVNSKSHFLPGRSSPRRGELGLRAWRCAAAFLIARLLATADRGAEAADASGEFKVFGSGQLSCQRWLDDRRESNPSAAQSEMWVAGYLTAYNQFVHKDKDVTHPYDGTFVLKWIDDYCRKRPANQLYLAARELLALLRRRQ